MGGCRARNKQITIINCIDGPTKLTRLQALTDQSVFPSRNCLGVFNYNTVPIRAKCQSVLAQLKLTTVGDVLQAA